MICNSSPLIFLSKTGDLEILKKLFIKIKITSQVKEEVLAADKLENELINLGINKGWIIVENPKISLVLNLGKGENSSISLAKEKNESLIIDDFRAIKTTQSLDLKIVRTTTLMLECVKRDILTKKQALEKINKLIEVGYYIAPRFYSIIYSKLF